MNNFEVSIWICVTFIVIISLWYNFIWLHRYEFGPDNVSTDSDNVSTDSDNVSTGLNVYYCSKCRAAWILFEDECPLCGNKHFTIIDKWVTVVDGHVTVTED